MGRYYVVNGKGSDDFAPYIAEVVMGRAEEVLGPMHRSWQRPDGMSASGNSKQDRVELLAEIEALRAAGHVVEGALRVVVPSEFTFGESTYRLGSLLPSQQTVVTKRTILENGEFYCDAPDDEKEANELLDYLNQQAADIAAERAQFATEAEYREYRAENDAG